MGNSLGRYTDLGNGINNLWPQSPKSPMNDRFGITLQRQGPQHFLLEGTFFTMFMHNVPAGSMWGGSRSYNLNQTDPNLVYSLKGQIDQTITNPFYNLLPATIMPGSLASQPTVTIRQMLKPYPQYGDINMNLWPGA